MPKYNATEFECRARTRITGFIADLKRINRVEYIFQFFEMPVLKSVKTKILYGVEHTRKMTNKKNEQEQVDWTDASTATSKKRSIAFSERLIIKIFLSVIIKIIKN